MHWLWFFLIGCFICAVICMAAVLKCMHIEGERERTGYYKKMIQKASYDIDKIGVDILRLFNESDLPDSVKFPALLPQRSEILTVDFGIMNAKNYEILGDYISSVRQYIDTRGFEQKSVAKDVSTDTETLLHCKIIIYLKPLQKGDHYDG